MSTDLLADLRTLRQRTRNDRHAYAFPLFLFGALVLLAPVCYVPMTYPPEVLTEGITVPDGAFPQFSSGHGPFVKYPDLVGWYWVAVIVGGLWLTAWWYRRRARKAGVETDVRVPIAAAAAAVLGFVMWQPLLSIMLTDTFRLWPLYSLPGVNLPILFAATVFAAAAFYWSRKHTGRAQTTGVFAGVFFTTVAFGAVSVYLIEGFAALVAIAVALLVLAWWERSALLGVIAAVFLLVSIPSNHPVFEWDIATIYGGEAAGPRLSALYSVLAPGVVLLAGGVAALVRTRR